MQTTRLTELILQQIQTTLNSDSEDAKESSQKAMLALIETPEILKKWWSIESKDST